jgi:hypothetical protein
MNRLALLAAEGDAILKDPTVVQRWHDRTKIVHRRPSEDIGRHEERWDCQVLELRAREESAIGAHRQMVLIQLLPSAMHVVALHREVRGVETF